MMLVAVVCVVRVAVKSITDPPPYCHRPCEAGLILQSPRTCCPPQPLEAAIVLRVLFDRGIERDGVAEIGQRGGFLQVHGVVAAAMPDRRDVIRFQANRCIIRRLGFVVP